MDRCILTAEEIQKELFTKPDDDWEPLVAISTVESGVKILDLKALPKGLWGPFIALTCRVFHANAIAVVLSAWCLESDSSDKETHKRAAEIGVSNMEGREEILLITGMDYTGALSRHAKIIRHEDEPPTLDEWQTWTQGNLFVLKEVMEYFQLEGDKIE